MADTMTTGAKNGAVFERINSMTHAVATVGAEGLSRPRAATRY
jgi:hypothetical protein